MRGQPGGHGSFLIGPGAAHSKMVTDACRSSERLCESVSTAAFPFAPPPRQRRFRGAALRGEVSGSFAIGLSRDCLPEELP